MLSCFRHNKKYKITKMPFTAMKLLAIIMHALCNLQTTIKTVLSSRQITSWSCKFSKAGMQMQNEYYFIELITNHSSKQQLSGQQIKKNRCHTGCQHAKSSNTDQ
jgi:hypothetical protein